MKENENLILYNAATGEQFESIDEFIKFYNQCYYISTSRWVEIKIEEILKKDKKTAQDFFNIFAWKTGRINQQKSEDSKEFIYTVNKDRKDKSKWYCDPNKGEAIAITRSGVIAKDEEGNPVPHKLYEYLVYLARINNSQKDVTGILKELLGQGDIVVPKGIGTVYLITFLYFISKGQQPIYDVFAMTALDAMYPDSADLKMSKELGSYIMPRNLPDKNTNGYEALLSEESVYSKYKELLYRFVGEYIDELKEDITPKNKYAACRDIDRALWVYGHMFRNNK